MAPFPPLIALLAFTVLTPVLAIAPGFPYGSTKVRGVNLGGWLVLGWSLPWCFALLYLTSIAIVVSQSLFDDTGDNKIVDEYTFCQYQTYTTALSKLQDHWSSWITEEDFVDIAAAGLNHVRLPIGYWAWDVSAGEPYIQGQLEYLDKAVTWAGNHGLKLIVDLHGAPGSQNGFDNSGQRMTYPTWQTQQSNIDRTNAIIKTLASKFAGNPSVVPIIAPLNEPAGFYNDVLSVTTQYWYDSYGNIRYPFGTPQQGNTVVLLHDAFKGLPYWSNFMTDPSYQGVAFDTHIYQIFSQDEVSRSDAAHISSACANQDTLSSFHLWAIVGEWTPAATDCVKYLNGLGVGARYDGTYPGSTKIGDCGPKTGSGATFSVAYKTFLRQYWEAQVISYEKGAGWIQWTWKAENADEWTYQAGLEYGWIPQDPTNHQYPNICG